MSVVSMSDVGGLARDVELLAEVGFLDTRIGGEFSPGDGSKEFWHQLRRKDGWRIHIVNWRRTPKTAKAWD